jgi:endonuclease/exonuclease/phosphatase family metal-dependent hydrolase
MASESSEIRRLVIESFLSVSALTASVAQFRSNEPFALCASPLVLLSGYACVDTASSPRDSPVITWLLRTPQLRALHVHRSALAAALATHPLPSGRELIATLPDSLLQCVRLVESVFAVHGQAPELELRAVLCCGAEQMDAELLAALRGGAPVRDLMQLRIVRLLGCSEAQLRSALELHDWRQRLPRQLRGVEGDVRIMTYNVLAQTMLERVECVWTPERLLAASWRRHRFRALSNCVANVGADLVCLQEIQVTPHDRHDGDWAAFFRRRRFGWHCVKRRPGSDLGCAIAWSLDTWRLAHAASLALSRVHPVMSAALALLASDRALLLLVSVHLSPLDGAPGRAARLAHALVLFRLLQLCPPGLSVCFAGDFNGHPLEPALLLLTVGPHAALAQLDADAATLELAAAQRDELIALGSSPCVVLASLYKALHGDEPEATSFIPEFKACIDYVLVSASLLEPCGSFTSPTLVPLLPEFDRASDHVWQGGAVRHVAAPAQSAVDADAFVCALQPFCD